MTKLSEVLSTNWRIVTHGAADGSLELDSLTKDSLKLLQKYISTNNSGDYKVKIAIAKLITRYSTDLINENLCTAEELEGRKLDVMTVLANQKKGATQNIASEIENAIDSIHNIAESNNDDEELAAALQMSLSQFAERDLRSPIPEKTDKLLDTDVDEQLNSDPEFLQAMLLSLGIGLDTSGDEALAQKLQFSETSASNMRNEFKTTMLAQELLQQFEEEEKLNLEDLVRNLGKQDNEHAGENKARSMQRIEEIQLELENFRVMLTLVDQEERQSVDELINTLEQELSGLTSQNDQWL